MQGVAWAMEHYSTHLLLDIYPLSREDYRIQSVRRRASYDYFIQIVEEPYRAAEFIIKVLKVGIIGMTYKRTLLLAKDAGILPADVVDSLIYFRDLRNKIVHDNPKANESLLLYNELFNLITLGFALYEIFSAYERCKIESFKRKDMRSIPDRKVVVNKTYLLEWLQTGPGSIWSDGFYDGYEESKRKAISKLRTDNNATTYIIDIGAIYRRCA